MTVVNDTVVEVCCSVVMIVGVENDNELVMEVLDGVRTAVMGKRTVYPTVRVLKCPVMCVTRS